MNKLINRPQVVECKQMSRRSAIKNNKKTRHYTHILKRKIPIVEYIMKVILIFIFFLLPFSGYAQDDAQTDKSKKPSWSDKMPERKDVPELNIENDVDMSLDLDMDDFGMNRDSINDFDEDEDEGENDIDEPTNTLDEEVKVQTNQQDKIQADKLAQEKVQADRLAQEKAQAEKLAQEKAQAEKLAQEKAQADT
jgi:hypothetical protein